ncbi:Fe-S cluster biogenesis protein NfuA [Hymenobacter luteus]|uniref:Fe-S cluster biogenesis protein NfuA n=2 Tax=Hymenobacter TaxID=89966 RepID=A0A7W9SY07_9BACT|nr:MULTISPECIES: NifU family protein [Hymenobacter]MBB4600137.1 Fe-S cluster biogenesis protein NfuA [Hymenobacter latericoloratus]MBB6057553.1 Fe-S cluster biogenesis protein NfuA [Hymenobacter luteus]MBX0291077.1 NifU family protein [Hymenobacter sp. HSC-4F20]
MAEQLTAPAAPVSIYAEASPNPESMKFVLNTQLLTEGVSVDYPNLEAAANSPLAQELFNFDYVGRVFIAQNFVTITKTTEHQWAQLIPELRTFLKSYVEAGGPIFTVDPAAEQRAAQQAAATGDASEADQQTSQKIIDLLDNYVRPAVEQDGGNITFKSYHEGIVTVNLQGSCSGCPSATVTLKSGIENLLKRMVPEVKEVVAEGVTASF